MDELREYTELQRVLNSKSDYYEHEEESNDDTEEVEVLRDYSSF